MLCFWSGACLTVTKQFLHISSPVNKMILDEILKKVVLIKVLLISNLEKVPTGKVYNGDGESKLYHST